MYKNIYISKNHDIKSKFCIFFFILLKKISACGIRSILTTDIFSIHILCIVVENYSDVLWSFQPKNIIKSVIKFFIK